MKSSDKNNFVVYKYSGEKGTQLDAPAFKLAIFEFIESNPEKIIVIDLSGVEYVDSSFLGVLVAAYKDASSRDQEIVISGLTDMVSSVFESTRLYTVFRIIKSVEEI